MCEKEEALGNRRREPIIETVQWRFAFEFHTPTFDVQHERKQKEPIMKRENNAPRVTSEVLSQYAQFVCKRTQMHQIQHTRHALPLQDGFPKKSTVARQSFNTCTDCLTPDTNSA